jgi:hypothetical protein
MGSKHLLVIESDSDVESSPKPLAAGHQSVLATSNANVATDREYVSIFLVPPASDQTDNAPAAVAQPTPIKKKKKRRKALAAPPAGDSKHPRTCAEKSVVSEKCVPKPAGQKDKKSVKRKYLSATGK